MRYFFIILWLFVVVSGKLTVRIERDHDSDEPSETIDDGKGVDGIDSGIGESETLDDHNDEVETEDGDSMSGTQDAKDSTNPSSLDQNPSIENPPSSTEQIGDSLNDDQRDELEGEETEVQQEVKEENSDLEFKPESESVPQEPLDSEQDSDQLDDSPQTENTDEDGNEENTEIDENPSLPIQTDEIDQPVEEPDTSSVTPVPNQDEPGFTQGEINQDSSNSSNTTEQTNTSTKTTTTSTTSSTILSTSTEDAAFEEEMREFVTEESPPATQPIETKVEENTRGRGTVLFFLLLISGAIVFFIFKWRMNRRNDPNRYISTAATFNNPVSFPDMNYHDDPL